MFVRVLIGLAAMLSAAPAAAQVQAVPPSSTATDEDNEQSIVPQQQQRTLLENNQAGRIARSWVGQRQTRESAAAEAGIKPMARIASRIQSRVQNRIRSRIDRNYDPQANTTDPFATAGDQARVDGRPYR